MSLGLSQRRLELDMESWLEPIRGGNGVPPNTRAGAQQNQNTAAAGGMPPPADRFHTPNGHYSNPADNVYAATLALCRMPIDQSPEGEEARRAIEMLKTAIT